MSGTWCGWKTTTKKEIQINRSWLWVSMKNFPSAVSHLSRWFVLCIWHQYGVNIWLVSHSSNKFKCTWILDSKNFLFRSNVLGYGTIQGSKYRILSIGYQVYDSKSRIVRAMVITLYTADTDSIPSISRNNPWECCQMWPPK